MSVRSRSHHSGGKKIRFHFLKPRSKVESNETTAGAAVSAKDNAPVQSRQFNPFGAAVLFFLFVYVVHTMANELGGQ